MKTNKLPTALCLALAIGACAPKPLLFDMNSAPDNERCNYMREVCKEARKFQSQYESMTREEKEDARAVMNAYTQQCEDAQQMCRQTVE
ncbi:MAG: hypothetical protein FWC23_04955 [Chitinispirillia bacterium]|nr:hypothetical protein [Chitinispirillia bacterium]MCL2268516.1 hypothetical protein [Chitinispirillia bacterium]